MGKAFKASKVEIAAKQLNDATTPRERMHAFNKLVKAAGRLDSAFNALERCRHCHVGDWPSGFYPKMNVTECNCICHSYNKK